MKKVQGIIFDLDGTLYSFDKGDESQFRSSAFGKQIRANCVAFFQDRFALTPNQAEEMFIDLGVRYDGEVSLALEKEFGIDRSEYFSRTWSLPVEKFIEPSPALAKELQSIRTHSAVLTAAPKVWAEKALRFLEIREHFGEAVFTGDPDVRKPHPRAFRQVAEYWNLSPEQIVSIGDQERTDILPAKSIGMQTLRIARNAQTEADYMAPDIISALKLLKEKGVL